MPEITRLLQSVSEGNSDALNDLVDAVYHELRAMASRRLSAESQKTPLQTTELVHEAYLRLFPDASTPWANRAHFFGAAAEAMRRVLVDAARKRRTLRRGGDRTAVPLLDHDRLNHAELDQVLDVHEALHDLEVSHPEKAALVKLRYFAGLNNREASEILGIGEATGHRHWAYARAWLFDRIATPDNDDQ